MTGRSRIWIALLCTGVVFPTLIAESTQAQGILRRIRDRVEARREEADKKAETEGTASASPAMRALRSLLEEDANPETSTSPDPGLGAPSPRSGAQSSGAQRSGYLEPLQPGATGTRSRMAAQATLGIHVVPSESETPGLVVSSIGEHSLADEAGLRIGDTIVAMNGKPTYAANVVAQQLTRLSVGDPVQIRFVRDGKAGQVQFPLVASENAAAPLPLPEPPAVPIPQPTEVSGNRWNRQMLGIEYSVSPNQRGLMVSSVQPNSIAAAAGIQNDDRIVAINGRLVSGIEAMDRELANIDQDASIAVKLVRGNSLVLADLSSQPVSAAPDMSNSGSPAAAAPSGIGGIGAVFNGLFGGNAATPDSKPDAAPISELPAPKANQAPIPNPVPDATDTPEGTATPETTPIPAATPAAVPPASVPPAKPEPENPFANPANINQAGGSAETEANPKVEQTGFSSVLNRLPLPRMENDPPSLQPVEPTDRAKRLEELKKREREIRLELLRLQKKIQELGKSE